MKDFWLLGSLLSLLFLFLFFLQVIKMIYYNDEKNLVAHMKVSTTT